MSIDNGNSDEFQRKTFGSIGGDSYTSDDNDAEDNVPVERAKNATSRTEIANRQKSTDHLISQQSGIPNPNGSTKPIIGNTGSTLQTSSSSTKISKAVRFVPLQAIDSSGNLRLPPEIENPAGENPFPNQSESSAAAVDLSQHRNAQKYLVRKKSIGIKSEPQSPPPGTPQLFQGPPSPHSQGPPPQSQGPPPQSQGPPPQPKLSPPQSKGSPPQSKGSPPQSKGSPPQSKGSPPQSKGPSPKSKRRSPKSKGSPPKSQGVITEADSQETWVTVPFDRSQLSPLELEEMNEVVVHKPTPDASAETPKNPLNLGNPSEEWLANIEKLFIHFFLAMFDTTSHASKVMLEMFPLEHSHQIEGTFRILFKMDSEMYKDLEHVVFLAQHWIGSEANKGPAQKKALHLIHHYKRRVKNQDYLLLSTEQRLHNLRSFLQSLEDLGDLPKRQVSKHNNFKRDTYGAEGMDGRIIKRQTSPRVKPGSHYARVVANILCDRPCGRPVTPPDVYADKLVKKFLKSEFITEKELQEYTDNMYGAKYRKTDIFHQINPNLYRKRLNPAHIIPVNRNCMLPIYTSAYLTKVKDGTCCPRKPRRSSLSHFPDGYISPRGHYHKYKIHSDSSEEWEHDFNTGMRTKRKIGYTRGPYGGYVVGMKNYYELKHKTKVDKDPGGDKKRRRYDSNPDSDFSGRVRRGRKGTRKDKKGKGKYSSKPVHNINSDPDSLNWEHDMFGRRTVKKSKHKKRLRNINSDPNSEIYEHDKKGRRTARKAGPLGDYYLYSTQVIRSIDSDPNSEGWVHDRYGNRVSRKTRSKRTKRRVRNNMDSDSDSDSWEHNKSGKRTKKKPGYGNNGKVRIRNIDSDPNSDGWEHDKKGKRTKRKADYEKINRGYYSQKKLRNIDSDSDSDAWEHDRKGRRTKRNPNADKYSYYGHKPNRHIDSDSDSDNWEHDRKGNRTEQKPGFLKSSKSNRTHRHKGSHSAPPKRQHFEYEKHNQHRIKGIKSDSDSDAWNHDRNGKRTKRKVNYKPRKAIDSDSDSDAWVHNEKGKRVKRKRGYKPRKSIASDSDSDAWEHNQQGRRLKRVLGYIPKKGINSDPDSDNWNHDENGKRTDRFWRPRSYGGGHGHHGRGRSHSRSKTKNKSKNKKEAAPDLYDKNGRRLDQKGRGGKNSDKLPHLGDGDIKVANVKAEPKRSVVQLPPLGKKNQKEMILPQVNYKMKDHKPKKQRSGRRNTKYVTESLYKGYAMNSDSDDSFDGNLNFVPNLNQDDDDDFSPVENEAQYQTDEVGGGDNGINTCWELSEILFKSPFNKNLIPAPENILSYIKHMIPRSRWPKGPPVATRKYPNGALLCSMFKNGSGLIFYPHGGLAVAISSPKPHHRVLVIRDPLDGFFFMDNAIMAQLNTIGHGSVFDKNGAVHTQYNSIGGFHMTKGVDQDSIRWFWNEGGIRLIIKLNKYLRLHVSKLDKIGVAFNANKRGIYFNVGAGRTVSVLSRLEDRKEELIGPKGRPKLRNPESAVVTGSATAAVPAAAVAAVSSGKVRGDTALSAPSMTSQMDEILSDIIEGKFSSSPTLTVVDKENTPP